MGRAQVSAREIIEDILTADHVASMEAKLRG